MRKSGWAIPLLIGGMITGAGATLPSLALAGKQVTSGQQTLKIKAGLSPARAGARNVTFRFRFDYASTTPGQQPPYNAKSLTVLMPPGVKLNPAAAPACKRSRIDKAKGDISKCPRNTIVGHGSVVVNAAPTISTLITGTATVYNAVNDVGKGQPKGTRNLIVWVKTSLGVTDAVPFRVIKAAGGRAGLRAVFTQPSQPGNAPGSFTIQTVVLTTSGKGSFMTNPSVCSGSWPFSATLVNYFNQPSITASDHVKCRP